MRGLNANHVTCNKLFCFIPFRLMNKAKPVVGVNRKCLNISVPPVSILRRLTKIHSTVINAVSAGKLDMTKIKLNSCMVYTQSGEQVKPNYKEIRKTGKKLPSLETICSHIANGI